MSRPKVTSVVVAFDDGTNVSFPRSGEDLPAALFWKAERTATAPECDSVAQILAGFYGCGIGTTMTYDELRTRFGYARADAACAGELKVELKKNVILRIWETEGDTSRGDDPGLLGLMVKLPRCDVA
jgi:hypothetical protein